MPVTHGVTGSSPVRTAKESSQECTSSRHLERIFFVILSALHGRLAWYVCFAKMDLWARLCECENRNYACRPFFGARSHC